MTFERLQEPVFQFLESIPDNFWLGSFRAQYPEKLSRPVLIQRQQGEKLAIRLEVPCHQRTIEPQPSAGFPDYGLDQAIVPINDLLLGELHFLPTVNVALNNAATSVVTGLGSTTVREPFSSLSV